MKKSRVTFRDEVKRTESTIVVYHDVCLKKNDIELLTGNFWLNDQIIAFYFQYLESQKFRIPSERLLFVPPAVTQLLKMSPAEETMKLLEPLDPGNKKRVIFFAVNDNESSRAGGTHWSLLVFSRREETFFGFDSLNGHNRTAAKKMFELLKTGLKCPKGNFYEHDCMPQTNLYDCGIHLLANTENVAEFFIKNNFVRDVPRVTQNTISSMRNEILALVLKMGGNV